MLNDSVYYTLYMAKVKSDEMLKIAEIEGLRRKCAAKAISAKHSVISHILEGAGNALVSTGNRLLAIA